MSPVRVRWLQDPDDPDVGAAANVATEYWRDAIGPDEPAYPAAELAWELTPAPGYVETRLAVAEHDGEIVGAGVQRFPLTQRSSTWIAWLGVRPEARRRGVGGALLDAMLRAALEAGRTRVGWRTREGSAAATALSTGTGAAVDEVLEQNRLRTASIDRSLMESWVARAEERAGGYSLVGWDGAVPDDLIERYARVITVMDDAPGTIAELVTPTTVATIRTAEARWLPRGPEWRLCARHDATGELVGFTELQLPDAAPWRADQGDTGVAVDHRERGLGRWLKAVNVLRLLDERPDVGFVDTTNAGGNEPMLAINREMGFRVVCRWQRWDLRL